MPILHDPDGVPFSLSLHGSRGRSDDPVQPGGVGAMRFLGFVADRRAVTQMIHSVEGWIRESVDRFGGQVTGDLEWDAPELRQLPADVRADADRLIREITRAGERVVLVRAWMNVRVPDDARP